MTARKRDRGAPSPLAVTTHLTDGPLFAVRWIPSGDAEGSHLWPNVDEAALARYLATHPLARKALADTLAMAARACREGRPPFRI